MSTMAEVHRSFVANLVDISAEQEKHLDGLAHDPEFAADAGEEFTTAVARVHHLFEADPGAHLAAVSA